jgi:hypothetical protein
VTITNRFKASRPFTCAQGRHGEVIVVQGGGVRPARWTGEGAAVDAGMDAPTAAPGVTVSQTVRHYIARIDVVQPGAVYYSPPEVTLDVTPTPPRGRPAKAQAYLSQAALSEISVQDGGKHYATPPNVALSDTHGKDAVIEAVLEGGGTGGVPGDRFTGISEWRITQQPGNSPSPDPARFAGIEDEFVDLPITGNGTFTTPATKQNRYFRTRSATGLIRCGSTPPAEPGFTQRLRYTVSGYTSGRGAVLRLRWRGAQWFNTCSTTSRSWNLFLGATILEQATAQAGGSGYGEGTIRVTIESHFGDAGTIVIEGYTAGNDENTTARRSGVDKLILKNGGSGYVVAPQIRFISNSGFGASAIAKVSGGEIVEVTLTNSGGGYKTPPTVEAVAGGAEAFAVARPHLRGLYQCYYRFVDDTPEDKGGPLPSNLSPLKEVDAGEGSASLAWTVPAPTGRAKAVELWRSTGNQATVLYRVYSGTATTFEDDLTDEEARDPDRAGYAAMPIVLPNGELNANRFVPPPSDKAVVVRFQDRYWYGVDTSGSQPNTVFFSEVDEPESVPDVNELILQSNARSADSIQALVPFGNTLLLIQSRHAHALTFARQPLLDAQVSPVAYRGIINQRCWDIHDGTCYIMDREGVYGMGPGGQVTPISDAIGDIFRERVDYSATQWFFLVVEPISATLRVFVSFKGDNSDGIPTRALCCNLRNRLWWTEAYPLAMTGAAACRFSSGDYKCVYASAGGAVAIEEGGSDVARGAIYRIRLQNRGSGYRKPPTITATGGGGATFRATLGPAGEITAIHILTPGHGYTSGPLVISPPPSGARATARFDATPKGSDVFMRPIYLYRSKRFRYVSDSDDKRAAAAQPRSVSLLYSPQESKCNTHLRLFYDDAEFPRQNVVRRDRGVGFVARTQDAAWVLDMGEEGNTVGSSRAVLEGRTMADVASADRHVAVEVSGATTGGGRVEFHALDIEGVAE